MKMISVISKFTLLLSLSLSTLALSADPKLPDNDYKTISSEARTLKTEQTNSHALKESAKNQKVNINEADAKSLAKTLKGIGLKKAKAIVEYRQNYGPFGNIQELASVKGIGKSTIQKNEALIRLN